MSIQQLATLHHTTPAAIRHYERMGLFDPGHVIRLENGYRSFTPQASERLNLIKIGQASGFSLHEMATELRKWCNGLTDEQKQRLLTLQMAKIDQKIAQLQQTKKHIEQAVRAMK